VSLLSAAPQGPVPHRLLAGSGLEAAAIDHGLQGAPLLERGAVIGHWPMISMKCSNKMRRKRRPVDALWLALQRQTGVRSRIHVLHVDSSLFGLDGTSSRLAGELVSRLRHNDPVVRVTRRDPTREPVPRLDAETFSAARTPTGGARRTAA